MNQIMHLKAPKKDFKIVAVTIFLIIMGILITTAFFGFTFTGNAIKNLKPGGNSTIDIKADLTIPELQLKGKFGEVTINGGSKSNLYVGDQKFFLGNSENNYVSLKEYSGEIYFDSGRILFFKGKAEEVSVNGIPITSEIGKTLIVKFDENFNYNLLEIKDGVSIKELNYVTSGVIKIGDEKNIFRVNDEEIIMNDFNGNMNIAGNKFRIDGKVKKLEIRGKQGISITS